MLPYPARRFFASSLQGSSLQKDCISSLSAASIRDGARCANMSMTAGPPSPEKRTNRDFNNARNDANLHWEYKVHGVHSSHEPHA